MEDNDILTFAMRIHSTEARHAAKIRQMRRNYPSANVSTDPKPKPWITSDVSNIVGVPELEGFYTGEDNTLQGVVSGTPPTGMQIIGINGLPVTATQATEAFDEPLTAAQVNGLLTPFIF